jgi:hypothetical protein
MLESSPNAIFSAPTASTRNFNERVLIIDAGVIPASLAFIGGWPRGGRFGFVR